MRFRGERGALLEGGATASPCFAITARRLATFRCRNHWHAILVLWSPISWAKVHQRKKATQATGINPGKVCAVRSI